MSPSRDRSKVNQKKRADSARKRKQDDLLRLQQLADHVEAASGEMCCMSSESTDLL
jgi:hypothetical protein